MSHCPFFPISITGSVFTVQRVPFFPLSITGTVFTVQRVNARGETISSETVEALHGEPYIEQYMLGLRFHVSPFAFFQVNSGAACGLVTLIGEQCSLGPRTVLLDVCCGAGTIGLALASRVRKVIGVEILSEAVDDAQRNAAMNGIENAHFVAAKAEVAMRSVLQKLSAEERENLVAIVDPPRAGLHTDVVKALRACEPLSRIIYVSCHAPGFVSNAVQLCRPTSNAFQGKPFEPIAAFPVDLFPHTLHCELVVLLERATPQPVVADGAAVEIDDSN